MWAAMHVLCVLRAIFILSVVLNLQHFGNVTFEEEKFCKDAQFCGGYRILQCDIGYV